MPPGIGYPPGNRSNVLPPWLRQPMQGPGMPSPRAAGQRAPGPSGLTKLLQQPGLRDALMATGSALMAQSDRPGTLGGALGRALPQGMQAFERGRSEAAVQDALQGAPESMRRLIGSLPAGQQAPAALQLLQQPEPEPLILDQGDIAVDPETLEEVARNPRQPDTPADIRAYERYRNMTPEEQRQFLGYLEARRDAGTTVNVGEGQSPAEEALVGIEAKDVEAAMEASRQAQERLASLREMERLLDEGTETGALESATMFPRELAAEFGVGNAADLARQQEFRALQNRATIAMTQGFKGAISEGEMELARQSVANLGNTPEANRKIIEVGKRVNQTAIDVAEAKREYFRENETLAGFETVRRRIVRENLLNELPGQYSDNNPFAN